MANKEAEPFVIDNAIRLADVMYPHRMEIVRACLKRTTDTLKKNPNAQAEVRPHMLEAAKQLEFVCSEVPANILMSSGLLYQPPERREDA